MTAPKLTISRVAFLLCSLWAITACSAATPAATLIPSLVPTLAPTNPPTSAPTSTSAVPPTATPDPALLAALIGAWKGDTNGSYIILKAEGKWNWDQWADHIQNDPENQGAWWLEGSVFYIQDLSGKDPCPSSQIGSYAVQAEAHAFTLTLVKDACKDRIKQTAGRYSQMP